jgi:uncharacterized membrane protein YoaK (UPF0700 family)
VARPSAWPRGAAAWLRTCLQLVFTVPEVRTRPERLHTGMPLAGVGGFLDAYTFVGFNGVFANAQTGNIVLLGVDVQAGHWREALLHVPPIGAFMLGVALAQMLALERMRKIVRHPTRWVLIAEIAVLAAVGATPGWIPGGVVTGAIAFVSAAQIATFRSLEGVEYTSTISTSNLRRLITEIFEWRAGSELASRHHAALLAWIIAAFAVGAGVGGLCARLLHQRAAWIAAAGLMIVLVVVFVETRRLEQRKRPSPGP